MAFLILGTPYYYPAGLPNSTPDDWVGLCVREGAGNNEYVTVIFSASPYTGGGLTVAVVGQVVPGMQSSLFAAQWAGSTGWLPGTGFTLTALVVCGQDVTSVYTNTCLA